jgi:hypothetical protein
MPTVTRLPEANGVRPSDANGVRPSDANGVRLSERQLRNRRMRNIAIAVSVGFLVVLFYVITIIKVGPGILRAEG